jgi:hypothetical protein
MATKYCDYCGEELETSYKPDKVVKTCIKDGVATYRTVNEMAHKSNSRTCPMCKGEFCTECIPDSEKLCPSCREISSKSDEINTCKHESVEKKFVRFVEKESGDYIVYEQTCNDCGVTDLVYEKVSDSYDKTESKLKKNVKLCNNCGEELESITTLANSTKTTLDSGVLNKSRMKDVITIESQCSRCKGDYCYNCLTYRRDTYGHWDLYLCPSCLKEFDKDARGGEKKKQISAKAKSSSNWNLLIYLIIIIAIALITWYYAR